MQRKPVLALGSVHIFYPLVVCALCLDIWSCFWFGARVFDSLQALFAATISRQFSPVRVMVLLGMLGIQSFLYYGVWGYEIPLLLIIACAAYWTWQLCTNKVYHAICVMLAVLSIRIFGIDWCKGQSPCSIFTLMSFLFSLILTVCISLKYDE